MITKIVIVGGGTAGWMTAAAFRKLLPKSIELVLVESADIPTVGVGEATIPPLQNFHRLLGISEQDFMSATQATFKLGIEFENWGWRDNRYFHSFGSMLKGTWGGDFQHVWMRAKKEGLDVGSISTYSLETLAGHSNKFIKDSKAGLNYAYHLDAGLYAKFLRRFSENLGVLRIEGSVESIELDRCDGAISTLVLRDGYKLSGDFFIDCTGFSALLLEGALQTGYDSWSHWLPCDRAIAQQTTLEGGLHPYTVSHAVDYGWQWRIPLQTRMGNGLVYCSGVVDDEKAYSDFSHKLLGTKLKDPKYIRFTPGKRKKIWNKNCLGVGLSSGFIEPLESTSIHLIMTAIMRFLVLAPQNESQFELIAAQYNRHWTREIEEIRDFIILHYAVGESRQSPFWDQCRAMALPDTLRERLELFKSTGQILRSADELFRMDSWVQVLFGQGLIPDRYHSSALDIEKTDLARFMVEFPAAMQRSVNTMPSHHDFIKAYCPYVPSE